MSAVVALPHVAEAGASDRGARRPRRGLIALLLAGAATLALVTGAERLIAERNAAALAALEARLGALASGRAEVLATWVDGLLGIAGRLTGSELVRLFAYEAALARTDPRLEAALAEQRPYMALMLEDLARQSGLVGAGILAADGGWLASDGASGLGGEARRTLLGALDGAAPAPRALLLGDGRGTRSLALTLPLPAPEAAAGEPPRAVVVLVAPAGERLERVLAPQALDGPGVATRLEAAQPDGSRMEITARATGDVPPAEVGPSVRATVRGLPWTVVQAADAAEALAPLDQQAWTLRGLAGGLALALGALVGLLQATWSIRHQRALAEQHQALARRIDAERRLLSEISGAVPDLVSLKDADGRYLLANRALATGLARGPEEILGRTDEELLDPDTAAALGRVEQEARATGAAVLPELRVRLGGRLRLLHCVALLLPDEAGAPRVLRVARDLTELARERERAARLREQVVAALVRTVELADPYLLGHSRALAELAERLAVRLGLEPRTIATARLAAELSQIGKPFVPRELLTKEGRHDPEEQRRMQAHVGHALRVLEGVELDLPVAAAIAQMHERLDGTGYPRGLAGAAIGPAARVLAVADVFLARTRPRSYRDAAPAAEVLAVLRAHPDRYDAAVVAALEVELGAEPSGQDG